KRKSMVFKQLQVRRFYDVKRHTQIYLTYSDKVVEGSTKNALSAETIMPWRKYPDSSNNNAPVVLRITGDYVYMLPQRKFTLRDRHKTGNHRREW
ncbi:hypothetical protein F9881_19155, partial [Morganella morganii]|nr:hypothetical protein [Morganella morganii]